MKRIVRAPSPAMIVAFIALVVALGGTSFAAITLSANSVGTTQLKNGAVTTAKIRNSAVTTAKIRNSAVTTAKIRNGAVTGAKVNLATLGKVPSAANADTLGGLGASGYQTTGALLSATVAPANASAAIVAGRGATAVSQIATGFFNVTFNRNVNNCTATATYGQPLNVIGVDAHYATVRGPGGGAGTNTLGIVIRDSAGAQADGQGFHVIVLCP